VPSPRRYSVRNRSSIRDILVRTSCMHNVHTSYNTFFNYHDPFTLTMQFIKCTNLYFFKAKFMLLLKSLLMKRYSFIQQEFQVAVIC
jgi:hypothetical protein